MKMSFRTLTIQRDPNCPACGTHEITELIDYDEFCSGPGAHAVNVIQEIQPSQLASRLKNGEELEIIDVREPYEWEIGHIPGHDSSLWRPLPRRFRGSTRRETILYCKMGARSMRAAQQLADAGVADVRNLAGGILRWIDEVDPTMARY